MGMEPRGAELISRYKSKFDIPLEANVTEEMILAHWELERHLTDELLQSTPDNRWEVFERCYSRLYSELEWINRLAGKTHTMPPTREYAPWVATIGPHALRIYEVGSGKGQMISYLAEQGYQCTATEITRERGSKYVRGAHPNLRWAITDGVNLEAFEDPGSYDVVLSNQVIEHLHPDDVVKHMRGAHCILAEGGRYIMNTPHCYTGPHDVSRVFNYTRPRGMHLKEYTYRELAAAIQAAGFARVYYASRFAGIMRRTGMSWLLARLSIDARAQNIIVGQLYLALMQQLEAAIGLLPSEQTQATVATWLRKNYLFADSLFLVAQK